MKHLPALIIVAAAAAVSLPAAAQFQKPEDAIKYRQGAFTLMGAHFGRLAGMAQGKIPFDAKAAAENAAIVATVAKLPLAAFGEGTDKGIPHRTKPEAWKDGAKFKSAAEAMLTEVAKLDTAAKSGNLDALKAAVGATGKTCKACHDDFRADKAQ